MAVYIAHYRSTDSASELAKGLFEFESEARMGSKAIEHDARMRMLELYGKDAVPWLIQRIEKKKVVPAQVDGQMELDFREPKAKPKRKVKKEWW